MYFSDATCMDTPLAIVIVITRLSLCVLYLVACVTAYRSLLMPKCIFYQLMLLTVSFQNHYDLRMNAAKLQLLNIFYFRSVLALLCLRTKTDIISCNISHHIFKYVATLPWEVTSLNLLQIRRTMHTKCIDFCMHPLM